MDPRHLSHKTIDILTLAPGVCAHINSIHIRAVQKAPDNIKLFLHCRNDFIFKIAR